MVAAKIVVVEPARCFGCGRCELACSYRQLGLFNFSAARLSIVRLEDNVTVLPVICRHCDVPMCEIACPAGAITKDTESGIVRLDPDLCVGCRMCFLSCPLGGIILSPSDGLPFKCDLCDGDPQCVAACDFGALQYVDVDQANEIMRARGKVRFALANSFSHPVRR